MILSRREAILFSIKTKNVFKLIRRFEREGLTKDPITLKIIPGNKNVVSITLKLLDENYRHPIEIIRVTENHYLRTTSISLLRTSYIGSKETYLGIPAKFYSTSITPEFLKNYGLEDTYPLELEERRDLLERRIIPYAVP